MRTGSGILCVIFGVLFLSACSESVDEPSTQVVEEPAPREQEAEPASTETTSPAVGCVDEAAISYLCGLVNAEDILQLGDSEWLLVSGMNGDLTGADINGKIHVVNHEDRSYEVVFPGEHPAMEQDMALFSDCPGPIDVTNFSSHGLALKAREETGQYRLYMTSHGAREAIEVFDIDASGRPEMKWIGCVPIPGTSWINSVVILDDGGFLTTQFIDTAGPGFEEVLAGEISGHLLEWHPGGEVTAVAGTELSGPNGIEISKDERWVYVAAFGNKAVVRFDRSTTPPTKDSVDITVAPDNVRWTSDGTLYTAGGNVTADCAGPDCGAGWSVVEIDPDSLEARRVAGVDETVAMQGVSSALLLGDEIWIGTYAGDRVGILPKP